MCPYETLRDRPLGQEGSKQTIGSDTHGAFLGCGNNSLKTIHRFLFWDSRGRSYYYQKLVLFNDPLAYLPFSSKAGDILLAWEHSSVWGFLTLS